MHGISTQLLILWLAIFFDLVIGELPNAVHPVAWMGKVIAVFQRYAPRQGQWLPLFTGAAFVIAGVSGVIAIALVVQSVLSKSPVFLAVFVEAVALKFTFSISGLSRAGADVQAALARGDLGEARRLLSWHLVSRDTTKLDESRVAAATIESLSENANDSCLAPLLFFAVGGLPAAFAYRFVNTCDAMLGYRDPDREWLGKTAARLDDVLNLIPARITAALIVLSGVALGTSPFHATYIWFRDRNLTASPNAGHPMSAAAGVLGIQLEKTGHYLLGDGQRSPAFSDIARARSMLWCTAGIATISISVILYLVR